MGDAALEDIADLAPSAKLVFFVLKHKEPLTQQELIEESLLPERTAREALTQLKRIDVVNERIFFPDTRQCLYTIPPELTAETEAEPAVTDK